jgi:hypothetical protein
MYEILFDLNTNLCDRFTALTPFSVRREAFHEVLSIYIRMVYQNERKKPENKALSKAPKGSFVIGDTLYKPAQNDDWW